MRDFYKLLCQGIVPITAILALLIMILATNKSAFLVLFGSDLGGLFHIVTIAGLYALLLIYIIFMADYHKNKIKEMQGWFDKVSEQANNLLCSFKYLGNTTACVAEDLAQGRMPDLLCLGYLQAAYLSEVPEHDIIMKPDKLLREVDEHGLLNETVLVELGDWIFRQNIATDEPGLAELWFWAIRQYMVRLACITGDDTILDKMRQDLVMSTATKIQQEIDCRWVKQSLTDKQVFADRVQQLVEHGAFVEVLVSSAQA